MFIKMSNRLSYNIRRSAAITLIVLSVYIVCNAYISFVLWCPESSDNCHSSPEASTYKTDNVNEDRTSNSNSNSVSSNNNKQIINSIANIKQHPLSRQSVSTRNSTLVKSPMNKNIKDTNIVSNVEISQNKWRNTILKGSVTAKVSQNLRPSMSSSLLSSSSSSSSSASTLSLTFSHSNSSSPSPVTSHSHSNKNYTKLSTTEMIEEYHSKTIEHRRKFNCPALMNGSQSEIQKVIDYHKSRRPAKGYPATNPSRATPMFHDCQTFKRIRGYVTKPKTEEEKMYPLAYVIMAHLDFDHLERLLHALYQPQHVFCIHLDNKVKDDLKQAVSGLVSCFPNVVMASQPQTIVYAHMSRLTADIGCMKDLLKSDIAWKYLINTAATAFPLRTNGEMVQILKVLNGKNDIHEVFKTRKPVRWKKEYVVHKGKMKVTNRLMPPPPHNLTIVKGQAYNTYSREFIQWMTTDQKAKDLLQWSSKTYSPDEHYWATLNNLFHNSALKTPGGFEGDPDKKGYITMLAVWAKNPYQQHECQGRNVHNICLFAVGDLPYLRTRNSLTANKFDLGYDPVAYACMEEWLGSRVTTFDPNKYDLTPYKRLRFVWYTKEEEKRRLLLKQQLKKSKGKMKNDKKINFSKLEIENNENKKKEEGRT